MLHRSRSKVHISLKRFILDAIVIGFVQSFANSTKFEIRQKKIKFVVKIFEERGFSVLRRAIRKLIRKARNISAPRENEDIFFILHLKVRFLSFYRLFFNSPATAAASLDSASEIVVKILINPRKLNRSVIKNIYIFISPPRQMNPFDRRFLTL